MKKSERKSIRKTIRLQANTMKALNAYCDKFDFKPSTAIDLLIKRDLRAGGFLHD